MGLNPLVYLLVTIIDVYIWVVIIWIIMSWLIAFNIINQYQPFVRGLSQALFKLTEPSLRPIRNVMPNFGGLDLSPIVLFIILNFVRYCVLYYFG